MALTKKSLTRLRVATVLAVLSAFEAPNLALLAYKAGIPIASTEVLGVEVEVRNGWYPVLSSDSVLGKAVFRSGGPPLVTFHRHSIVFPWRTEVLGIMYYKLPPNMVIEATQEMPWGTAMKVKARPAGVTQSLFAVPGLDVGILVEAPGVLEDIKVLYRPTEPAPTDRRA